jgi:hypothetical protein
MELLRSPYLKKSYFKLPDPEELLNLLGLGLISLLLISFGLPLKSSVEYAFTIDASSLSYSYCI